MKTKLFAVCLLFALSGCDVGGIRGNGHMVTQEQKLEPFINVEADGAFRIEWHSGPPAVSVTIDENLMQYRRDGGERQGLVRPNYALYPAEAFDQGSADEQHAGRCKL